MAVKAVDCSDSFGLGMPFIVEVNVVVNAIRKSSQDLVVLRQAILTVVLEIHIKNDACAHVCKIVRNLIVCSQVAA